VAPTEQSPTRPNVAPGSPVSTVPSPAPARSTEQDTASVSPPPVVPPAAVPAPIERPPSIRNDPAATPSVALRPSFDCAKATNDAERIVCSDNQLAGLDVKMADLYRRGLSSVTDSNVFSSEQQIWLSQRDDCADRQCLVVSYNDRIKELERWVGR